MADESADGIDASQQIHGNLPTLRLLPADDGGQVQRPMIVTCHDDSRPAGSHPRVQVHLGEK